MSGTIGDQRIEVAAYTSTPQKLREWELEREVQYLRQKCEHYEKTTPGLVYPPPPSLQEVEEAYDNILYNISVALSKDMRSLNNTLIFRGSTEKGEKKQYSFRISDSAQYVGGVKLPGLILGLPS